MNFLFATNRARAAQDAAWGPDFTDEVNAFPGSPQDITFGVATVENIDIQNADSGTITSVANLSAGAPVASQLTELLAPTNTNDILVFVHGADNSFSDAITRTAYNQAWLAAAGLAGPGGANSTFDMIAFTWPGRSYGAFNFLGEDNVTADFGDYRHDQTEAGRSGYHCCQFLLQLIALRQQTGRRRLNLLCHSMGNFMLGGAVEMLSETSSLPPTPLFDQVILAAADEIALSFSVPDGGRLSDLHRLGREITVYSNNNDLLMAASRLVNGDVRLGYDGPADAPDPRLFPTGAYDFVNCTGINDSTGTSPLDSHQYYRESPRVRADIVATLLGLQPNRPNYDAQTNSYKLFT